MKKYIFLLLIVLCLTGCQKKEINIENETNTIMEENFDFENKTQLIIEEPIPEPTTEPEPTPKIYELSLIAVGDNLIHSPIYKKASNGDGTYNFLPMYENIKDTISSYDISIINQETIFVEDDSYISSYPCFGTPIEMGNALVDTGFDVILNATNHTWDKKSTGVTDTLNYWKQYPEITILGIHENEEDFNTIDIIEKNNIKLALFNYTYGLNGFVLPNDKTYMVDLLDNKEKFINDVIKIENDVDFTICFLHIGTEYVYEPTNYQVEYVNSLIDAGADIIICAHPHVIEPYDMITTQNGNSALVYYSCGNFISNQDEIDRVLGGMAEIKLQKTILEDNITNEILNYDFIPIVTHYNSNIHTIYKLEDYTEELAEQHRLKSKYNKFSIEYLWDLWNKILKKE